jgi:tetratricopeptide (TPR) repeat protein
MPAAMPALATGSPSTTAYSRHDDALLAGRLAAAHAALARGDAAEARATARAARLAAAGASPQGLGEAWMIEAVASNILFDHAMAFECALEADALLEERQVALRSRAFNARFVACAESGDLARALDCSRRAMELAQSGGDLEGVARALHNRGTLLRYLGEHEAAQDCLREAVARYEALPTQGPNARLARVSLAMTCLNHARQLAQQGHEAGAQARRRQAAQALPELGEADDPGPHLSEMSTLCTWIIAQAELGRLGPARQGMRRYLGLLRRAGRPWRFQGYAMSALAAYCFHAGRRQRGLRLQQAALENLRQAGSKLELLEAQERLVRMQAAGGSHAQALAGLRAAHLEHTGLATEQARLRARMATVERQVQLRQAAQRETLAHTQRLAVVGRLMADIYHALDGPLTQVQRALTVCTAPEPTTGPAPAQLLPALSQVIRHIDSATGLARQLRMFSYRAAPQAMVVNLHDSLHEAWDGVALWRRGMPRVLDVTGDAGTQVRVDAQRLAVLLRILLMEADQAWPGGALSARLAHGPGGGRLQLSGGAAPQAGMAPVAPASVGLTLCGEIAREMAGEFTRGLTALGDDAFVLQLPAG